MLTPSDLLAKLEAASDKELLFNYLLSETLTNSIQTSNHELRVAVVCVTTTVVFQPRLYSQQSLVFLQSDLLQCAGSLSNL